METTQYIYECKKDDRYITFFRDIDGTTKVKIEKDDGSIEIKEAILIHDSTMNN